jgi:biuret amidohydrolase
MTPASALLILDLQNEMVDPLGKVGEGGLARIVEERGVLEHAARVLSWARSRNMHIVFVRLGFRADYSDALSRAPRISKLKQIGAAVVGSWGTEFPAVIAPRENELIITKQCVNPFYNTGLLNWLFAREIREIIIGGVVTNLVVESTARAADDAGLTVTVLEDLCAAPNIAWHIFSTENILPLFSTVTTSDALT